MADSFAQKTWKPLEKFDFKNNKWQLVYMERTDNDSGDTRKFWIINDSRTIDSLKSEFKGDYDKQCDGSKEYHVYLYKDNFLVKGDKVFDWIAIYGQKKYFSFGKIKKALVPVSTHHNLCPNLNSYNILIDSLNMNKITYTVLQTDSIDKSSTKFSIRLELLVRWESKLISESKSNSLNNTEIVIQELERLYPQIPKGNITAKSIGGNVQFLASINSNDYFKFDISRLKDTDLFRQYKIIPTYTVTTYSKL